MNLNSIYPNSNQNQSTSPKTEPRPTATASVGSGKGKWRDTVSTILIIIAAPLIAFILVLFVFQSYQVDGPSMQTTLFNGDRLIVWKLPKTWSEITGHQYVPDRGDIIIFNEPSLNNKQLVKRVIGLPGDRVVVSNNEVTIYNKAHPNGFDPDTTLPYSQTITIPPSTGQVDITLGPHQLWVMGDNRGDSLDSRYFGPIKTNQVIGKLALRILPINKAERF